MASNLYGTTVKLYTSDYLYDDINAFKNKKFLRNYNITIPITTKTLNDINGIITNSDLFNSNNWILNTSTASKLDTISSTWFDQWDSYFVEPRFKNTSAKENVFKQFPLTNEFTLTIGMSVIIWDEKSNVYFSCGINSDGYYRASWFDMTGKAVSELHKLPADFLIQRILKDNPKGYGTTSYDKGRFFGSFVFYNETLQKFYVSNQISAPVAGDSIKISSFSERLIIDSFLDDAKSDFIPYKKPTDPYSQGNTSTSGGGGGTFGGGNTIFGGNSDSIDVPPLPTASASSAGFITLFNPTLGQLNNLANYMWSDLFSLDTFKKIFADPMDCILGLSIVPVKPASAGTSTVKIGNISTDVSMNKTSSQYVAVDCGTIDVKEYWGAYLDYAPYTQCEIYLPYVGTKQISVDDVMNKAVHVVYHVDILSGACNAYVKCGDSVLYTFVGQCSSSIPISGNDWTNVLNGAISVAGKLGLAMATGGATALMSGLGAASSIISSSKPTVERSGAMSSTGGLLGIQKPYLILTRPKQALPENQNKYTGYPSFITMALSDCTGYTEIDSVHLENMTCTDEEAQEIENLLTSGVIF